MQVNDLGETHLLKISMRVSYVADGLDGVAAALQTLHDNTEEGLGKLHVDIADNIADDIVGLVARLQDVLYNLGGAREGLRAVAYRGEAETVAKAKKTKAKK
jgi:hypothetical protein